ncbi:MAG: type 4a pilus biogenesis protein PilO [Betaproteobacteria bacterium]|nr:type 4a pilus biogenesis protein PilO [Betaproteobacteria bacterium]
MVSKKSRKGIDFNQLGEKIASQFRGLNPNDPGSWPLLPKIFACLAVVAVVSALGWFLWLSGYLDSLRAAEAQEDQLKQEYRQKLAQAVNLDELRKQKELVTQYVRQLEKQLPSKAEMDALLSDINQAGVGRGLQFELFKPGQTELKDYYAELPISVRVSGGYHEIASFAADIANLSRIVTLNNVAINNKDGKLVLESTVKTFRYLDPDEVAAKRAADAKAKQGQKK